MDPKSVQRWVDGPTRPYPRNRAAIARALNLTEQQLWPDETIHPGGADGLHGGAGEVTGSWGHATDDAAPDPVAFIENSDGPIDILDTTGGIELTATFLAALIGEASARASHPPGHVPTPQATQAVGRL